MARYTLKSYGRQNGSEDSLAFDAFNDNEAVASILSLRDGRPLELWCDSRMVWMWKRPASEGAEP